MSYAWQYFCLSAWQIAPFLHHKIYKLHSIEHIKQFKEFSLQDFVGTMPIVHTMVYCLFRTNRSSMISRLYSVINVSISGIFATSSNEIPFASMWNFFLIGLNGFSLCIPFSTKVSESFLQHRFWTWSHLQKYIPCLLDQKI